MKDDEPEWFSGGPTSQLDTIELRGFDDHNDSKMSEGSKKDDKLNNNTITNNTRNNNSNSNNNRRLSLDDMIKVINNRNKNKKSDNSNIREGINVVNDDSINIEKNLTEASTPPPARSTPAKKKVSNSTEKNRNSENDGKNVDEVTDKVSSLVINNNDEVKSDGPDFNFEDFLKLDSLSGLLNVRIARKISIKFSLNFLLLLL